MLRPVGPGEQNPDGPPWHCDRDESCTMRMKPAGGDESCMQAWGCAFPLSVF